MKRTFRAWAIALVAALALGIAACGDDDDDGGGGGGGGGGEAQAESIKAGVVTDIGGLNDRVVQRRWPTTACKRARERARHRDAAC